MKKFWFAIIHKSIIKFSVDCINQNLMRMQKKQMTFSNKVELPALVAVFLKHVQIFENKAPDVYL